MAQQPPPPPDEPDAGSEKEFFIRETQASAPPQGSDTETVGPPKKAEMPGGRRLEIGDVFEPPTGYSAENSRIPNVSEAGAETSLQKKFLNTPEPVALGQYEIVSELGRGGMGVVYKGFQRSLGRHVGLKVLPDHLASNADLVARFKVEARAAARLNHPNITGIYEIGEHKGTHFFAMEFVEGETLSHLVHENGPLPLQDAISYLVQSADALAFAHTKGVIHRDIKPSNIMLTEAGHVKVMDFGLARIQDEDHRLTMTGMTLGTPAYMSPEQAGSERVGPLDHRADIYSLGVVLFELITGRLPFDGRSKLDIMRKIIDEEPPRPSAFRGDIPIDLERVVLKAMAKEVAKRYETAAQMRDDLKRIAMTSSTETMPSFPVAGAAPPGSPLASARRGRRLPYLIAGALATGLLVALAILGVMERRAARGGKGGRGRTMPPAAAADFKKIEDMIGSGDFADARRELRRIEARSTDNPEVQQEALTHLAQLRGALLARGHEAYAKGDFEAAFVAAFESLQPFSDEQREALRGYALSLEAGSAGMLAEAFKSAAGDGLGTAFLEVTTPPLLASSARPGARPLKAIADLPLGTEAQASLIRRSYLGAVARRAGDLNRADFASAALLALAESAEGGPEFVLVADRLLGAAESLRWDGARLAAQSLLGRDRIPLERRSRPIQQSLVEYLPLLADPDKTPPHDRAEKLGELWKASSPADLETLLGPLLPLEDLLPKSSPANRFERLDGVLISTTAELHDASLPPSNPSLWNFVRSTIPPSGVWPNSQLPQWFLGKIELGDGNGSLRSAAFQTDGSAYLFFIDQDLDGDLSDEVPVSSDRETTLDVLLTGRFSVVTHGAFIFKPQVTSGVVAARNVGARGTDVDLAETPVSYALVDADSDGLYNDFSEGGAVGRIGVEGSWHPLIPDVPFEVGGRFFALADLTALASATYWREVGELSRDFGVIVLQETPRPDAAETSPRTPPTAARILAAFANGVREFAPELGPTTTFLLPNGMIDLFLGAPGYVPIRATQATSATKAQIRVSLEPWRLDGETLSATFSAGDLARGVALALTPNGGPLPTDPADRSVREFALRRKTAGSLELTLLVPRTRLSLHSDGTTVAETPDFAAPSAPVPPIVPPIGEPLVLTPLEGRMGYTVDLQIDDEADGGCKVQWIRRLVAPPPIADGAATR